MQDLVQEIIDIMPQFCYSPFEKNRKNEKKKKNAYSRNNNFNA